jgi:hypothetical protein
MQAITDNSNRPEPGTAGIHWWVVDGWHTWVQALDSVDGDGHGRWKIDALNGCE